MKAQGQNVVEVMVTPAPSNFSIPATSTSSDESGRRLDPGELLLLGLPVRLTKKTVDSVSLNIGGIQAATLG